MVVAEFLRWGAPLQLVLCLVLLAFHEKALQSEDRVLQLVCVPQLADILNR